MQQNMEMVHQPLQGGRTKKKSLGIFEHNSVGLTVKTFLDFITDGGDGK